MADEHPIVDALRRDSRECRVTRAADRARLRDGMRAAVEQHGLTHRQVAEATGMGRSTVTQILAGRRWSEGADDAL